MFNLEKIISVDTLSYKTISANKATVNKEWVLVDAENQSLDPAKLVEKSVKGMLPKNKLGANLFRNLTVVVGSEHAHAAQKPKTINLNEFI